MTSVFVPRDSATGTGRQTTTYDLGEGRYRIYACSMNLATSSNLPPEPAHIAFQFRLGDGTYKSINLRSGYMGNDKPLCWTGPIDITGPGQLYTVAMHYSSHAHYSSFVFEKVTEPIG